MRGFSVKVKFLDAGIIRRLRAPGLRVLKHHAAEIRHRSADLCSASKVVTGFTLNQKPHTGASTIRTRFWGICMYICLYVYMSICIYVYMYICIYVYMYICVYVYMYICVYVYVYMYICIYVCMYVCMYVCENVCMYVCR